MQVECKVVKNIYYNALYIVFMYHLWCSILLFLINLFQIKIYAENLLQIYRKKEYDCHSEPI